MRAGCLMVHCVWVSIHLPTEKRAFIAAEKRVWKIALLFTTRMYPECYIYQKLSLKDHFILDFNKPKPLFLK
jgi:hypothetical protein